MMRNNILIIGSGLGGLLTGFMLSKEGFKVTVVEKHRKFGGCLQTFKRDRYTFDTGMHYIGSLAAGQALYQYWKYFGLSERLDILKMDNNGFDRISFGSFQSPDTIAEFPLSQGFENFREQLLPFFPGTEKVLKKYTTTLEEIAKEHPLYNLELPGTTHPENDASLKAFVFLKNLGSRIRHPASGIRLSEILAGNNFLYAGNPATTPLSQFALINHSFISSTWRLNGGSQQLADILVEGILSHGGEVLAKKKVTSIRRNGDLFYLETTDNDRLDASQIVSDIHPASTLELLDGIPLQKAYRERIHTLQNTFSVFTVYLGLKPDVFPFLNYNVHHHAGSNVWAAPGPSPLESPTPGPSPIREGRMWPSQFLFMTPPEKGQGEFANTAVVMAPMLFDEVRQWERSDSGAREKSYFVFKTRKAKLLLEAIYRKFPELRKAVATIDISTPLTWRDYTGTPQGSIYGIVKDASAPQRTTIFPKTKIPGLYFTGQNVNLHGALGVTIGAVMTCGEMLGLPYVLGKIKG